MPDGRLEFDTRIDQSGFEKGLKKLEQFARKFGVGDVLKGVLGADLLKEGTQQLGKLAIKSIQLASDLEEVQNVVDTTFGDGADTINDFSKNAISAYGLSELQAKRYSSTLGAMTKSMGLTDDAMLEMSQSLTGLVGDMASFYNLDHDTAFDKIRAGISGETEPLKQLGINMSVANLEAYALSKGLQKAYEDMSEAEKVQLRYGYIMAQTTDAQGDFVRTQDGYANQVRLLQNNLETLGASVGSVLVPKLTSAVSWLNSLFAGPGETNATQTAIDGAVASLGTLEEDIKNIQTEYAKDAIQIRIDYEQAAGLLDTLTLLKETADSKGFGERTLRIGMEGGDVAALQEQLTALGLAIEITDKVGVFGASTEAALKEYQTTMGLVADGIAGAKTYAALNAEDTAKLVAATQQLVDIYPDLAQYVGKDGLLTIEMEEVKSLIEGYRELAIQKALAAKADAYYAEVIEAEVNLALLKQKQIEAEKELTSLRERQAKMQEAYAGVRDVFAGLDPGETLNVEESLAALDQWISAYGGLSDNILNEISRNDGDLAKILNADGTVKALEDITGDADDASTALGSLVLVLNALNQAGAGEQNQLADEIEAGEKAVSSAKDAVEEYTPMVEELNKELETVKETQEALKEKLTNAGTESGKGMAESAAQSITDNGGKVDSAVEEIAKSAQRIANRNPVIIPVKVSGGGKFSATAYDGSHATGLDYVPFDGYIAKLHVGESVLNASDARAWRAGESKGGGGVTPAQLTAAMEPVVDAIRHIRIALDIDGEQFANNQAVNNRNALSDRARMIARGYGK